MVRLKAETAEIIASWDKFQFHNGSIKGLYRKKTGEFFLQFQFHNGSIKGFFGNEKRGL